MTRRFPHVFTLLVYVIAVVAAASFFIPSGRFAREVVVLEGGLERTLVVPGSYEALPKHITMRGLTVGAEVPEGHAAPLSLIDLLSAVPRGLEESADIVFFLFVMGATFGVLSRTGVITATIGELTRRFGHLGPMLVAVLVLLMGVGGSTLGMGEEFIPLVPVFLLLSRELGYDRLFGLAIVNLSATVGFAAATTNPFTVAVAQGIADVPIHSGLGFRVMFFAVAMALTLVHLLRYGFMVQADPKASLVYGLPAPDLPEVHVGPMTGRHVGVLLASVFLFGVILAGVQTWQWWMAEMGGGFLLMMLTAAAIGGLSPDATTRAAIDGMREMVVAALVVGVARGIVVVMADASILDTLVHATASVLEGMPPLVGAEGMFVFQTVLNLFVPSGSGQAAVTMPLMAPLADLLGITRQTAVFAFQCGDGLSNMIIPTSGTLMAMLLMAKVPYDRWVRFALPLFLQLSLVAALFLAAAVLRGWN